MSRSNLSISLPLFWLRVPPSVIGQFRSLGFHDGCMRRRPNDADIRLTLAFSMTSSAFDRDQLISEWISDVDREASSSSVARPALWHHNIRPSDENYIKQRFAHRLVEIHGDTFEEAIHQFWLTKWNFGIFYHIACLGNWRSVVTEHFRLLSQVGLSGIRIGMLGTDVERRRIESLAVNQSIEIAILYQHTDPKMYEVPTIRLVHDWAKSNDGYLLYFHTKGVSHPKSRMSRNWRHLMNRYVIKLWRQNAGLLRRHYDLIGVNWRDKHWGASANLRTSHFTGNFWMARTDYVRNLEEFSAYYLKNSYCDGMKERPRLWPEFWVGSGDIPPRILSYVSKNERIRTAEYWQKPGRRR